MVESHLMCWCQLFGSVSSGSVVRWVKRVATFRPEQTKQDQNAQQVRVTGLFLSEVSAPQPAPFDTEEQRFCSELSDWLWTEGGVLTGSRWSSAFRIESISGGLTRTLAVLCVRTCVLELLPLLVDT